MSERRIIQKTAGAGSCSAMGRETIQKSCVNPKNEKSWTNGFLLLATLFLMATANISAQNWMQDMLNSAMQMYDQQTQQLRKMNEDLERKKQEHLKNLKVNLANSYSYKDRETGKYGAAFFFNDNVGINDGFNPIKVYIWYGEEGAKNPTNIIANCTFWENMIIVSPVLRRMTGASGNTGYLWIGIPDNGNELTGLVIKPKERMSAENFEKEEAAAIRDYDKYVRTCTIVQTAILQQMQIQNNPFASPFSGPASSGKSSSRQSTCSYCLGKGWVAGGSTPCYGTGNKYCNECRQTVSCSHSHDRCPSCGGKGYR
jgi:hypothetical protein